MTIQEFFEKWNGKFIDYDNFYGAQCFDLIQQYNKELYQGPFLTGNAAFDLWESYPVDYYERILNTPTGIPEKGDIVIWGKEIGQYGHVAIFSEGDINKFISFDQNFPLNSPCHFQNHDYRGVIGWLHPLKNLADSILVLKANFEKLVGKATKLDNQIPTYEELKQKLTEYQNWKDGWDEEKKVYTQFIDSLSIQLGTPNKELAAIAGEIAKLIAIEDDLRKAQQEKDTALEEIKRQEKIVLDTAAKLKGQEEALNVEKKVSYEQEKLIQEKDKLLEKQNIEIDILRKQRKELAKYSTKELILEIFNRFKIGKK